MTAGRPERLIPWAIVALALALRLAWLPLRPPHSDEGVNGWFADKVVAENYYRYDPENYHGPLHYYLLALSSLLFGHNLWALRLPTALFGAAAVWLTAGCADALGRRVAWTAALLLATSPAMVLYSRWAIHEIELVFFSLLVLRGWCRSRAQPNALATWQMGIGAAGALATKEVWVVHAAALVAAWLAWRSTRQLLDEPIVSLPPLPWRRVLVVATTCLALLVLLYSGFGRDSAGLGRFFSPFAIWTHRAMQGAGHEKPWHYWLDLFVRYEPAALLGLLAAPLAAVVAPPPIRLLALYGLGTFAAYSLIHYKTPWCVLELIWPLLFVTASVLDRLASRARPALAAGLTAALALASLAPAVRMSFVRYADPDEPYIYVQTFPAGLEPIRLLERAAERDPTLHQAPIHVLMKLSWPLPWLLAAYPRTGHWSVNQLPPGDAAVLFVDEPYRELVEPRLRRRYFVVPFKLSPAHAQAFAYFDAERFAAERPAWATGFVPPTE